MHKKYRRYRTHFVVVYGELQIIENIVSGGQSTTPCLNKSAQSRTQSATMASALHIYNVSTTKARSANWVPTKIALYGPIYPPNTITGVYLPSQDTDIHIIFPLNQAFPSYTPSDL